MKRILTVTVLSLFHFISTAQNIVFTDSNFKNCLLANNLINVNNDNEITVLEAQSVTESLIINPYINISSLDGIENFINIKHLTCTNNNMQIIDLSQNTKLITINLSNNKLTYLDVSTCENLLYLNLNHNKLPTIDLNSNTTLTYLNCNNNSLIKLNITNAPLLKYVDISYNSIKTLNLQNNILIDTLILTSNLLPSLDLSKNINLTKVDISSNQITSLDFNNNTILQSIFCDNNKLSTIDLSSLSELSSLTVDNNNLISLDASNNLKLKYLVCSNNQIKKLNLTMNDSLRGLSCNNNQIDTLDLDNHEKLESLNCSFNKLSSLLLANTHLYRLYCQSNNLTFLDLTKLDYNPIEVHAQSNPNLTKICIGQIAQFSQCTSMGHGVVICQTLYECDNSSAWDYSCTTGIENNSTTNTNLIYPNPAKEYITVGEGFQVIIFNLMGQEQIKTNSSVINVGTLKSGIYQVVLIDQFGKKSNQRFIKE